MASIAELVGKLQDAPADDRNWHQLGTALFCAGDVAGLRNLFNSRHSVRGKAMDFAWDLLRSLIVLNDAEHCLTVLRHYPDDCPFSAAVRASLGYLNALAFDLDPAVANVREALRRMEKVRQAIPTETPDPSQIFKLAVTATLLETEDWSPKATMPAPEMLPWGPAPNPCAGPACVAFADSVYFRHYARQFISGVTSALDKNGLPVVGVIDPDSGAIAEMENLAREFPRAHFLTVRHGRGKMAEMAASYRFIGANKILEYLARPVVFLDVDSAFPSGAGDALNAIAAFPLSYQYRAVTPPYLIVDACAMGAQPGRVSQLFFNDTADFLLGKMAEDVPLWHIDQAALHRAVSLARVRGDSLTDITSAFKDRWELPAFFKKDHAIEFSERLSSRTNADFPRFHILPQGQPLWAPLPQTAN